MASCRYCGEPLSLARSDSVSGFIPELDTADIAVVACQTCSAYAPSKPSQPHVAIGLIASPELRIARRQVVQKLNAARAQFFDPDLLSLLHLNDVKRALRLSEMPSQNPLFWDESVVSALEESLAESDYVYGDVRSQVETVLDQYGDLLRASSGRWQFSSNSDLTVSNKAVKVLISNSVLTEISAVDGVSRVSLNSDY